MFDILCHDSWLIIWTTELKLVISTRHTDAFEFKTNATRLNYSSGEDGLLFDFVYQKRGRCLTYEIRTKRCQEIVDKYGIGSQELDDWLVKNDTILKIQVLCECREQEAHRLYSAIGEACPCIQESVFE